MTITLGVLDVLLFLLPGLVAYTWAHTTETRLVQRVLPTAGSITILMIVPLLALFVHMIFAAIFALQEFAVNHGVKLVDVPFDPNIYSWVYLKNAPSNISGVGVAYALFTVFFISASPIILLNNRFVKKFLKKQREGGQDIDVHKDGEDWLNYLIRKSDPSDRWLVAYIVTHQRTSKGAIGYAGLVEKIGRDTDGNISFVVIDEVQTFLMKDTENGAEMVQGADVTILPIHSFQREDYASISFNVGFDPEPSPDEAAQDPA